MSIYNAYLTGEERELAVQEAVINNEYAKYCTLFEMVCLQQEQMERDAELKVFSESGTYDDLAYLIEAAAEEVAEKKDGIIKKIIGAIKSLINTVINKVKSFFGKGLDDNAEIEVPKDAVEKHGLIAKAKSEISAGVANVKSGKYGEAAGNFAKGVLPILGIGAGATAAAVGAGVLIKKKVSEVKQMQQEESDQCSLLKTAIDAIESKLGVIKDFKIVQSALTEIKKVVDFINTNINNFGKAVTKAAGDVANSAKETASNLKGKAEELAGKLKGGEAADDAVETVTKKNSTFKIFADGSIKVFNSKGVEQKLDKKLTPPEILKAAEKIKATQESVDVADIQEMIGSDFTVDLVQEEDALIITGDVVIESEVISKSQSIFGAELALEEALQGDESYEADMDDLAKDFEEL